MSLFSRNRSGTEDIHVGEERPDLIPLLDVIFSVLACFAFLLASSEARPSGLAIELPEVSSRQGVAQDPTPPLVLTYSSEGELELDGTRITKRDLAAHLGKRLEADPNLRIRLSGDQDAPHGLTAYLVAEASRLGVKSIEIAVHEIPTKKDR